MTLHSPLPLPAAALALRACRSVVQATEDVFTAAGVNLTAALDRLGETGNSFARLRGLLDDAASARLLSGVAQAEAEVTAIAAEAEHQLAASTRQRLSVRAVRVEVEELDRVVRTISNVSVNARIQAGALSPPRPQVAAFIQRLAAMTVEAESVLAEVRLASAGIEADMAAIDTETNALREVLAVELLPALSRFALIGRALHDRQGAMAAANADMEVRMRLVQDGVARLVVGLQVGDSTRQRLERVVEALAAAQDSPPASEAALLVLARSLAQGAMVTAQGECDSALDATRSVKDSATEALKAAERAYLPLGGGMISAGMDGPLAALNERLARLAEGSARVTGRLATILEQEGRLRQVAHQVRLSGLNAVLVCAKLGDDGRALRELAQWLRALTDESDAITARLQAALAAARTDLARTGGEPVAAIGDRLSAFRRAVTGLNAQVDGIETGRAETAARCKQVSTELDRLLGDALMGLRRYAADLAALSDPMALMVLRQATLPPPDPADPHTRAMLDGLRQHYTMQAERDLHDGLFPTPQGRSAPALATSPAAPVAGGDLDDVFF